MRALFVVIGLMVSAFLGPQAGADGFCDETEGCSPCETIVIDPERRQVDIRYC